MLKNINLVSWNVHMHTFAKDNSYVVEELEEQGFPDVICLQEYVEGKDSTTMEWLEKHDYDVTYLPFSHYPQDKSISQGVLTAIKSSMNATMSTHILREDEPRRFRRFKNIRGVIESVIKNDDGTELSIINFHATLPRPYLVDMRRREFNQLTKHIEQIPGSRRIFLCGDFNFFGIDSRKQYLQNRFQYFTGTKLNKTWRHYGTFSPIRLNLDFMFWSRQQIEVSTTLRPFKVSDHRPLLAEIKF